MANKIFKPLRMAPGGVGISVKHNSYVSVDECDFGEDEYSRPDTYTDHSFDDVVRVVDQYPDVVACFDVDQNTEAFLVYATYSTGDSFGHDYNSCYELIDLYVSKEKADQAVELIQLHERWNSTRVFNRKSVVEDRVEFVDPSYVRLTREDQSQYDFFIPWYGYFESLVDVDVKRIRIKR